MVKLGFLQRVYSTCCEAMYSGASRRVVLLVLSLLVSGFSQAASVTDVRVSRSPDQTRVVLDLSGPVQHNVITLTNPDRIVIDIENATNKARLSSADLQNSPISRIRSGIKDKNDLRIVFDMSAKVKPKSFLLKKNKEQGDRLVIDLQDKQSKVVKHIKEVNNKRDIVIAIDAGHGGKDPGASGPTRLREKHVVLAIAKELNYLIKQERGFKPVMIRTGDYFVPLKKRREKARKAQADLFVSIHADAFTDKRAYGTSVFALSSRGATSTMASFLAKNANDSDLVGGVSLNDKDEVLAEVLTDLSMTASIDASMEIGKKILHPMGKISRLHSKRVEQASFAVLKSPDIPSILVETGFISNPGEEKKLRTKDYQRKMARAIYKGISAYFNESPPPDTYVAWAKNNRQLPKKYTIARGDTLSGIAQRYRVSVAAIRRENQLASSVIKVGQKIIIPAS